MEFYKYSEYTKKYVQDICDAFNNAGFVWGKGSIFQRDQITSGDFDTLTEFLHQYVIEFSDYFNFFNKKGLVNTGRCPFTGQKIDSSFPRYTYMRTRSIYFSHKGAAIWQKETAEDFEKVMGRPMPTKDPIEKSAPIVAEKTVNAASYKVLASFGVVRLTDPSFARRKANDKGSEYIIIRDANGDQMIVGLMKDTPKGANAFEIKQLEQIADYGEVKAGQVYFKAFAVVEKEEE